MIDHNSSIDEITAEIKRLEDLKRQKKNKIVMYGKAKCGVDNYGARPDEYYISINVETVEYDVEYLNRLKGKNIKIVKTNHEDKLIERLDKIIDQCIGIKQALIDHGYTFNTSQ
jgi:3-dehydroquinate dehydratase